jgi:hypothetical protein
MAMSEEIPSSLEQKLNLIIHLLCLLVDQNRIPSMTEQIALLASHGLSPSEIGKIVGREANYVSASLKQKKKGKTNER